MPELRNTGIAQRLEEVADLLQEQGANPYRVRAYRQASQTLRTLPNSLAEMYEHEGLEGLRKLHGIGESLARSIRDLILSGRLPMLDRLRGEADPVELLASVPGVGEALATRLHDELGIDTLEELEAAAHDGRLSDIAGIGGKKLSGIIDSLAGRLGRVRGRAQPWMEFHSIPEPSVEELLEVDMEYRREADAGRLRMIAPRRLNPTHEAWLAVLHTQRSARHYTALFSNTARAHRFGKTRDWVILYYDGEHGESQCTIITAERGILEGHRIIRGREDECVAFYQQRENDLEQRLSAGFR